MSAFGNLSVFRGSATAVILNRDANVTPVSGETSLLAKKTTNQPNNINFTPVDFQSFESNGDFIVTVPTTTFECQRAGRYLITAYMATNPTGVIAWGNEEGLLVTLNGAALFRHWQGANSTSTHVTASFVADLDATDLLTLQNYNTTGVDTEIVQPTQLSILRVSQ